MLAKLTRKREGGGENADIGDEGGRGGGGNAEIG